MCCEVLCIERDKKVPLIYMNKSYNQRGTFCISYHFILYINTIKLLCVDDKTSEIDISVFMHALIVFCA